MIRLDGGLFFATSEALEKRIRDLLDGDSATRAIVLDLEGVNFVDSQGSAKLTELHELAESYGIPLHLARLKASVRRVLEADGVIETYGPDRIHGAVTEAVEAAV